MKLLLIILFLFQITVATKGHTASDSHTKFIISCDINNTITNTPDTAQESIRGALSFEYRVGKTVAESLYTNSPGQYEERETLADYIKSTHKLSRDTIYADLLTNYPLYQDVLPGITEEKISELLSQIESYMRLLETQPYPLFEQFYRFAEKYTLDENTVLVMQTFGKEATLVQAALRSRNIPVDDIIGIFDENHVLTYDGVTYANEAITDLLLSNTSKVWLFKTYYNPESGPIAKYLFQRSGEHSVGSVLIDDNVLEYLKKGQLHIIGDQLPNSEIEGHLLKAVAATLMDPEDNTLIDFVENERLFE